MREYTTALTGSLWCDEPRQLMENFAVVVKELLALHQQQFEAAVLMAASESAIVAGECQPHRQCRMAASGPQGRSPERAGGHGASFWDNWFQGRPMPLPRRWRREKNE
jgi:hypothetical protein